LEKELEQNQELLVGRNVEAVKRTAAKLVVPGHIVRLVVIIDSQLLNQNAMKCYVIISC